MKKSLKALNGFETQTEKELREVMGGRIKLPFRSDDEFGGGIMLLYGIRPDEDLMVAKYGVFVPDSKNIK